MSYPLVRDLAAAGIPVRLTCGVLGFSAQAFYKWHANPVTDRDWADAHVLNAIIEIHADDPEFGYRFIADELEHAGHVLGESRVHRLCRQQRVWSTTTKKGRRSLPTGQCFPSRNLSDRAICQPCNWPRGLRSARSCVMPPADISLSAQ